MDHSPYEILGNNVLISMILSELNKSKMFLKNIGMTIEWTITIEYLVTNVFPSPFDFFQEFGSLLGEQRMVKNWPSA